jgi:hypothetical protein
MSGHVGTFVIGQTPIGGNYVQSYTAQDMCYLALKNASLLGVGQTPLTEDLTDVFNLLNGMLGLWSRNRWLIWHLLDLACPTPQTTKREYSIGPGGDYDFPRPDRLEGAYFRQFVSGPGVNIGGGPVDFPLQLLQSMEDYSLIALKYLTTWPQAVFYDAAFPYGQILPVPIPNVANSELHVLIKDTLNQFSTLTTSVYLPPEYYEAIWSNLAVRVAAAFPGASITPLTVGLAKASLQIIRKANAQVPRLRMMTALVRPPLYNIFSGQTY